MEHDKRLKIDKTDIIRHEEKLETKYGSFLTADIRIDYTMDNEQKSVSRKITARTQINYEILIHSSMAEMLRELRREIS